MHCSPIQCCSTDWRLWPAIQTAAATLLIGTGLVFSGQAVYIHAKALLAQVLLDRAFAASLVRHEPVKPWSWADTWPVARIEVPRLDASAIVLAGASGQALAFGPGHISQTPAPGEPGTSVIAAHRDTHFDFLGNVNVGDAINVTRADGRKVRFTVTGTSIARWDASGIDAGTGIDAQSAPRRLVLATCWPLDARTRGPLRYLVHAEASTGMSQ